jgi:hypothetical protein
VRHTPRRSLLWAMLLVGRSQQATTTKVANTVLCMSMLVVMAHVGARVCERSPNQSPTARKLLRLPIAASESLCFDICMCIEGNDSECAIHLLPLRLSH